MSQPTLSHPSARHATYDELKAVQHHLEGCSVDILDVDEGTSAPDLTVDDRPVRLIVEFH